MKQIEITVRVKEELNEVINKLEKQGFKKNRESDIDDIKKEKQKMYDYVKQIGLNITDEQDVQKAYELVEKSL